MPAIIFHNETFSEQSNIIQQNELKNTIIDRMQR